MSSLKGIKEFITQHPDRDSMFEVLAERHPIHSPGFRLVANGYQTAKEAFDQDTRRNGERYFEHLRRVTLILMYYRIYDPVTLCVALNHDTREDKKRWSEYQLELRFNSQVAEDIEWVSKGDLSSFKGNKNARDYAFFSRFPELPRRPSLVKLADRLDNLMDLWDKANEKSRDEKISQTRAYYLPLAERQIFLFHELEEAMVAPP